jgi:hypothetical protein
MPRILAPSIQSRRGSNGSLPGSQSSLVSYGSRRSSISNQYHASHFALRRPSANDSSVQSSLSSMRNQAVLRDQAAQQRPSMQNSVWSIDSPNGPPSLVNSDASVRTDRSLSRCSSQSSMQSPIHRLATDRRASMPSPTEASAAPAGPSAGSYSASLPGALRNYMNRRASLKHTHDSFLPSGQINEEGVWGQFVDVADADEDLVRRMKILSLARNHRLPLGVRTQRS